MLVISYFRPIFSALIFAPLHGPPHCCTHLTLVFAPPPPPPPLWRNRAIVPRVVHQGYPSHVWVCKYKMWMPMGTHTVPKFGAACYFADVAVTHTAFKHSSTCVPVTCCLSLWDCKWFCIPHYSGLCPLSRCKPGILLGMPSAFAVVVGPADRNRRAGVRGWCGGWTWQTASRSHDPVRHVKVGHGRPLRGAMVRYSRWWVDVADRFAGPQSGAQCGGWTW